MDIRIYFQVFIYFLIAQINFGQEVYSFRSDYGYVVSQGRSIIELDSAYGCFNMVWIDTIDPYLKVMFNYIDKETGQYRNVRVCEEPVSYTAFVRNNYIQNTDSSLIFIGLNVGNNRCIKKYEFKYGENKLVATDLLCDSLFVFAFLSNVFNDSGNIILCGQANRIIDNSQNGEAVLVFQSESGEVEIRNYGNNKLYNSSSSSIVKRGKEYCLTTLHQLPNKKANIKLFNLDSNFTKMDSFMFSPSETV